MYVCLKVIEYIQIVEKICSIQCRKRIKRSYIDFMCVDVEKKGKLMRNNVGIRLTQTVLNTAFYIIYHICICIHLYIPIYLYPSKPLSTTVTR